MKQQCYRWIDRGLYTPAEASRLTGISAGRIRRWVQGHTFICRELSRSPTHVNPEMADDDAVILTFRDLVEVICVQSFLEAGVKWPLLRTAHERAAEILHLDHPFVTRKFLTDGQGLLIKLGKQSLLGAVRNQQALDQILSPHLKIEALDFEGAFAAKWWPMGRREPVVVDAARSFGQPVVKEGVPTLTLYRAYMAETRSESENGGAHLPCANENPLRERTVHYIADWYSISMRSVRSAIEYELRLAA